MYPIFYLTILFLVTLVVLSIRAYRSRARHRRGLALLARSLGLTYRPHDALQLAHRYSRLLLMREGHDRRTWDLITGPTAQGALTCFAYRYEVGFGINRAVRTWRVAVLETRRRWERLALRHNRGLDGLGDIWEPSCSTVALPRGPGQHWTLICRNGRLPTWFPQALFEQLADLECDLHLELCDHLIALQVPMDDTHRQVERLARALQRAVSALLAAAGDEPQNPQPTPTDPRPLTGGQHA